jgi:hypothetical protein
MTSENNIKFTCTDADACDLYPPVPSAKMVPEWYKDMPVDVEKIAGYIEDDGVPSVKRCVPVLDYITSGYVIRNSYEIVIKPSLDASGIWKFESKCSNPNYVNAHPWFQAKIDQNNRKTHYFKIHQQWKIETPAGYSCLFYQPHYFFRKEISFFPAVVDTDKHNDCVAFVGSINTDQEFTIAPGEPLMVIFPFKREEWKMTTDVDPAISRMSSFKYHLKTAWHGTYQKFMHSKKSYR